MVERRGLLAGSMIGGLLGVLTAADAGAAAGVQGERDTAAAVDRVARKLDDLREEVRRQAAFDEIAPVRSAQLDFLRVNHKFPDYIELGTTHWFNVHDWHVRWQQPLTLGTDAAGRHYILFMQTRLVLRPDVLPSFISQPFDLK